MKTLVCILLLISSTLIQAQSEYAQIEKPLMDYIEGTANGEPDRLKRAFHPDFNLYFIKDDKITVWSGKEYVGNISEGKKSNRIGRIVSIDVENNAAVAKIEIDMPDRKRLYTDYLLLLKEGGEWKIVHKSFTYVTY